MKKALTLAVAGLLASSIAAQAAVTDGVITGINYDKLTVTLDNGTKVKVPNLGALNTIQTAEKATVVYQPQSDGTNMASEIIQRK